MNDLRRGTGVFAKVMHAMDLLKENGLVFGTSICYTSKNYKTVTSDEFIDMIVEKGCRYALYFHYMPVGNDASLELLPNPKQRLYIKDRVREIRNMTSGKGIFTMDFQNDGEFVGGCIAGGRNYFHINANGGAKSTDLQSPESAEHLCNKCKEYAQAWKPCADKLWAEEGHSN